MDVLLGVALGAVLSTGSFLLGMGSAYVLLKGLPKIVPVKKELDHPVRETPYLDEVIYPSMEGVKPPQPDGSWEGGDIGPVLGVSDAAALATYDALQQDLLAGKVYPEWLPDYWEEDYIPR